MYSINCVQMCDAWYENMDNGKLNGVVFIDIRKAFDSINHNILLRKMKEQFGISNIELKLFESYLTDREQVFFVDGTMSTPKRIVCGVPEGSTECMYKKKETFRNQAYC